MRFLLAAALLALTACKQPSQPEQADHSQASATLALPTEVKDIPAGVSIQGKLLQALRWQDKSGDNMLLLSQAEGDFQPSKDGSDDVRDAHVYAAHYLLNANKPRRLWLLQDGVEQCMFDVAAKFDPAATRVADLDGDGVMETMIAYSQTCTSDVSPHSYKLILHAGKAKYGLRGTDRFGVTWRDADTGQLSGTPLLADCSRSSQQALLNNKKTDGFDELPLPGCYADEKDFAGAPPAFLPAMRQQWHRLMQQQDAEWRKNL
ncbi:M949_RS01915 family surface polysaccharide biosynthesis protein [Iodobacter arcticus]|uniref:M949_RS01915 family surface polysaccharide biosynthesis protein n=1 Tax=Iodobacter arcticus TaxID=590593 RepID=A0ABW2R3T4_9NEIS